MLSIALTIFGLAAFEIVASLDNAVINAQVLSTIRVAPSIRDHHGGCRALANVGFLL